MDSMDLCLKTHMLAAARKNEAGGTVPPKHNGTCRLGVWGDRHEHDTHYLRVLVGKLRQKLSDDAASPRWIVTEPWVGLRFIGEQKIA